MKNHRHIKGKQERDMPGPTCELCKNFASVLNGHVPSQEEGTDPSEGWAASAGDVPMPCRLTGYLLPLCVHSR